MSIESLNFINNHIANNAFDYSKVKENSIITLIDDNKEYDVNIIIGCRGRKEFIKPIIESFERAIKFFPSKSFIITIVDHNTFPENKKFTKNRTNYIWSEGNVVEQYSRSFAYNFGVKYSNKSKYYLLHDLDILVKENFFEELFENLKDKKCIQPYGGRRVLYMSKELTDSVLEKNLDYNSFSENTPGVTPPMYNGQLALGSKGGSIFIERELFLEVGGFDPEIFWGYAAEDQFFWEKVNIISEVAYADNPKIDMFHMWHPPSSNSNPLLHSMENIWIEFKNLSKEKKETIITLKKYIYGKY